MAVRLVGGILVILLANQPDNVGLLAGALVCLNIGVVPLLLATLGMVRKWYVSSKLQQVLIQ